MKIVSVGEILWDVVSETEHLGGAPLNFAAHSLRLGNDCAFVSAVGDDERGRRALDQLRSIGLTTKYVAVTREHPTGHVSVTVDAAGQPCFVIHRPAAYDFPALTDVQLASLRAFSPQWVYFG